MFSAGVAALGGTVFFLGNDGGPASPLVAFGSAIALAAGFWYVIASRVWLRAACVYALLLAISLIVIWAADRALQQNPALWQDKSKEIACLPGLLIAHGAALIASLTRLLNGCSYERAMRLANELGIDPNDVASRYGALPVSMARSFQPPDAVQRNRDGTRFGPG